VQQQLAIHCWSCHGSTLQYTAPMKLLSVEDFQAPAPSDPSQTVGQRVQSRIHDIQKPMPPAPLPALDAPQLVMLDDWLASGAPPSGPQDCEAPRVPVPPPPAMAEARTIVPIVPALPELSAAGGMPRPAPAQNTCVEFRAHGATPSAPFTFNGGGDVYRCFEFNAPWGDRQVYGVSVKPLIGNTAVIHHMLLNQHSYSVTDGASAPCVRTDPNAALIAAWAPGARDWVMPDDVGMDLTAPGYSLEVHYNGSSSDNSGFELCYTTEPRAHTAAMHWLGTTNILGTSATGVCRPNIVEPVHTLKYWPHMHLAGSHLNVTINRADGSRETWHDEPFDFADQRLWDTDKIILPGDTITTTCSYNKPSIYGEGTKQEMCFDVVLAYPVGALTQPGGTGAAANQCMDGS
jgi:hypothetical protein